MSSVVGASSQVLSIQLDLRHLASISDAEKFFNFLFHEVKGRLITAVIKQQLVHMWSPLSKAYKAHKVKYGLNPGMWVATHQLIESLCLDISVGREFVFARILCNPKKSHNGVPMWMIAKYLEYGTRRIPPRPLFRPIAETIHRDLSQLLERFYSGDTPTAFHLV